MILFICIRVADCQADVVSRRFGHVSGQVEAGYRGALERHRPKDTT